MVELAMDEGRTLSVFTCKIAAIPQRVSVSPSKSNSLCWVHWEEIMNETGTLYHSIGALHFLLSVFSFSIKCIKTFLEKNIFCGMKSILCSNIPFFSVHCMYVCVCGCNAVRMPVQFEFDLECDRWRWRAGCDKGQDAMGTGNGLPRILISCCRSPWSCVHGRKPIGCGSVHKSCEHQRYGQKEKQLGYWLICQDEHLFLPYIELRCTRQENKKKT